MLKVLRENEKYPAPCALLLGGFDGFHIGHETLLEAAKKTGLPVGLTSISGGKAGGDIFTFSEREVVFERAGFDFVIEIEFSNELQNTSAEDFLRGLFEKIPVRAVFCGEDFRFGKGALGTPSLLKACAPCPVTALPLLAANGEKVATSTVKSLLATGEVARANEILRGGFFLQGKVGHGRGAGRTFGFPTANLNYPAEKFPLKEGVYGGFAETDEERFPAVVNFGACPTFGVEERHAEAYLKGFSGDLYGKEMRLYPTEFLRPVRRFASCEALQKQLEKDVESV